MLWSRQQHAIAGETYFSNGRSVIAVQRAFRRHFDFPLRGGVPGRKCVLMWMEAWPSKQREMSPKKGPL
ncbi:hypothetical protein TNCV_1425431 [Trichonephila clavipes]|nr:hypothetical protein TNCV_1425431 [Trichonephila clavipes]